MRFITFIFSLCLVTTASYATNEFIKESDKAKSIAKTLNDKSSPASAITAFDDNSTSSHKELTKQPMPHSTTEDTPSKTKSDATEQHKATAPNQLPILLLSH